MIGFLSARVALRGGRSRVVGLEASAPLAAKVLEGPEGPTLMLVGSAAGLLEGDATSVELVLEPGTSLRVSSAAATIAHPCPGGGSTTSSVTAAVGAGARLSWLPEGLVACARCSHTSVATLTLEVGGAAVWYESLTLGRSGEQAGSVSLRLDATVGGAPLLRDGLRAGGVEEPSLLASPAVLGCQRHTGSVHLLGRGCPSLPIGAAGVMALAGPGATFRAVAPTAAALHSALGPVVNLFTSLLVDQTPEPGVEEEVLVHG